MPMDCTCAGSKNEETSSLDKNDAMIGTFLYTKEKIWLVSCLGNPHPELFLTFTSIGCNFQPEEDR